MLFNWISRPLSHIHDIEARLDFIDLINKSEDLHELVYQDLRSNNVRNLRSLKQLTKFGGDLQKALSRMHTYGRVRVTSSTITGQTTFGSKAHPDTRAGITFINSFTYQLIYSLTH